jgi:hypothetical protein
MGRLTPDDLGFLFRVCDAVNHPEMGILTIMFHISSKAFFMQERRMKTQV